MKEYLKLMRIKHYIKNLVILLPLIFSVQLLDINKVIICTIGILSFSLLSSAVYIFNDIYDIEKDKKHQVKRNRPIASGKVSKRNAILLMSVLIIVSAGLNVALLFICNARKTELLISVILQTLYLILNITYSIGLKNIPILDVSIIVAGFIIRMTYGATITGIEISNWLYLTIMAGSFFMGFGKRRNETIKQGTTSRDVLSKYNKEFLDKFMYVCLILAIVFYSLWCIDITTIERVGNNYMIFTIPLLLIILMKYCLSIETDSFGDPVDVILNDKILLLLSTILALVIIVNIYIL